MINKNEIYTRVRQLSSSRDCRCSELSPLDCLILSRYSFIDSGTVVASPSSSSTLSQDFTASFSTSKTDASYSRSLAISSLFDNFCQYGGSNDGRYSVIVS